MAFGARSVLVGSLVVVALLLLSVPGGAIGPRPTPAPVRSNGPHLAYQQFSSTYVDLVMASNGSKALSTIELTNLSDGLYLSDVATNRSTFLGVLPGGLLVTLGQIGFAGGHFFLDDWNATTLQSTFVRVSPAGSMSTPTFPIGGPHLWGFPYGNATALFASSNGSLVELDPSTLTILRNFTARVPAGLVVDQLLPIGGSLYLVGRDTVGSRSSAFFGVLQLATGKITALTHLHAWGSPWGAAFYSIARLHGYLYLGGGVTEETLSPNGSFADATGFGLIYRYNLTTGAIGNRSFLVGGLPDENVFAVEPWKSTLVFSVEGYDITPTVYREVGGLYTLATKAGSLVNVTTLLPPGFLPDFFEVTSESGGYLILAGMNEQLGLGALAAIPT
jgi:hypothetical protein